MARAAAGERQALCQHDSNQHGLSGDTPLAYTGCEAFRETPVFTAALRRHLDDDQYRQLQIALMLRPEQGPVIRGSGGLRKVRWATTGGGKRGGLRVIYCWAPGERVFYMVYAYAKLSRATSRRRRHVSCEAWFGRSSNEGPAFQELLTSVRQAGEIRRGTRRAVRTTTFRPPMSRASARSWERRR